MNDLIIKAVISDSYAQEAKAKANLVNYITNSVGVGEHPDVVEESKKLVKQIADARELRQTAKSLSINADGTINE